MLWISPEINNPRPGGLLLIGRDLGTTEMQQQKPFVGQAGWKLNSLLIEAGIDREEINITNLVQTQPTGNDFKRHNPRDVERGIAESKDLVQRLRPNLIVTFGNEASYAFTPNWPSKTGDIWGAYGIQERRGYLWLDESGSKTKVLTMLHPAACLVRRDPSGINSMLLLKDLERARDESKTSVLDRSNYNIVIVHPANVISVGNRLAASSILSCDIECYNSELTSCIGFAPNSKEAFVFPPQHFDAAHKLLLNKNIGKIFHNAQFDLYHLLSRDNIRVDGRLDDTMIAWHCLWPEIASQREGKKSSKKTHKSLAFLESIYGSSPIWWKDYEFSDDAKMYELNGIDCCKTFGYMEQMNEEINDVNVRQIYEHERKLIWPVVEIQHRGLLVDAEARSKALDALESSEKELAEDLARLIEPLLQERRELIERPGLFWKQVSCKCCGNGKKKKMRCWACAGFEKSPSKAELVAHTIFDSKAGTKEHFEQLCLSQCRKCKGQGQWETFQYNPGSNDQTKEILYNILHLPKRMKKGKLSSDEEALKALLGGVG